MITSKLILHMCSSCNKLYNIYVQYMGHEDSGGYNHVANNNDNDTKIQDCVYRGVQRYWLQWIPLDWVNMNQNINIKQSIYIPLHELAPIDMKNYAQDNRWNISPLPNILMLIFARVLVNICCRSRYVSSAEGKNVIISAHSVNIWQDCLFWRKTSKPVGTSLYTSHIYSAQLNEIF